MIDYLLKLGFKCVKQTDELGWLKDPNYLFLNGLFAEIHDDNQFYLWFNPETPIIATKLTPENILETQLKIIQTLQFYKIPHKIKPKTLKNR